PRPARHRDRRRLQACAAPALRPRGLRRARPERRRLPRPARRGRDDPLRRQGPGHRDGGARRVDGLRLRQRVHRELPRGVRAAHPRRPARGPAALPPPAGGRAVLGDPRPDHRPLGVDRPPGGLRPRLVGTGRGGRDAGPRRPSLADAVRETSMITTMHATTAAAVGARLTAMRRASGALTFTRVLTLIIVADDLDGAERGIRAANGASREHPCRIIAVVAGEGDGPATIDAQIRVGGDAGLSEVVILQPKGEPAGAIDTLVMPLLLPDAPIVVWWTGEPPAEPSKDPLGAMAQRRITDVTASADPLTTLRSLAPGYAPGDTDLAWARVTLWRGLLAATL